MTWSELERLIKKAGWQFDHHGTRHDEYIHPEIMGVIQIERHKSQEVKTGLLNKILKDAGMK
ncbi:MAG: type II toxin-antitoxin system HicA family toxin [Clostridia bacterium]